MPYRPTERTERRKAEARERIVAAALAQLADGGYASASVQVIAQRAGIATGSVYRHFQSKAELFAEVFRRASTREIEAFAGPAAVVDFATRSLPRARTHDTTIERTLQI